MRTRYWQRVASSRRPIGGGGYLSANTPLGIFAVSGYANQTRAYSLKPALKGGNGTKSFTLSAGTLPTGLSLNATTGEITGTPASAGTTSGLAITVTDGSGPAVSNTFSIVVGAAPVSVTPSGVTTGGTDIAAINAQLALGNSVVLSGSYFTNAPIVQPGNTAIYADSGSLKLADASNCQMWVNTNQGSQTRTDQNMAVVGAANFFFNGNGVNQTLQTNVRSNQGFTAISVSNLSIRGIKINSRAGAVFMIGTTYGALNTIEFAQTTGFVNNDGFDVGGGCSNLQADSLSGIVNDDAFSFFAKNKQSATMMAAGTPWETGADVSNIYINNTAIDCNLKNMFRLQAGNTFKLTGIYGKGITNTHAGSARVLMQTGAIGYLDSPANAPLWSDIANIVLETITGFDTWARFDTSCSDVHVYGITQNRSLITAVTCNEGGAPTLRNVSFDGVTDTSPGTHASLIDISTGYWNDVRFKNIAISDLTTFCNITGASLQTMVFSNLAIAGGSAPTVTSTLKSSGTFTGVTVGGVPLVTSAAFQAIAPSVFTDDFNRADENLSASANWLLRSGVATGAQVASNVLKTNDTASAGTAMTAPDLGTMDHYAQIVNNLASGTANSFLCARLMDYNNYVGCRYDKTNNRFDLYQRVLGVLTSLGTATDAAGVGKTMRLEVVGFTATLKVNGATVLTSAFSTALVSSRTGINARTAVVANWGDNFECGAM